MTNDNPSAEEKKQDEEPDQEIEEIPVGWDFITIKNKKPHVGKYIKFLDGQMYGADHAKRTMALAVRNAINNATHPRLERPHQNILLIGNDGTGKSFLPKKLAAYLSIPFVKIDLATITPEETITVSKDRKKKKTVETLSDAICKLVLEELAIDSTLKGNKEYFNFKSNSTLTFVYLDNTDCLVEKSNLLGDSYNSRFVKEFTTFLSEDYFMKHIIPTQNMIYICGGIFRGIEDVIAERVHGLSGAKTAGFKTKADRNKTDEIKKNIISKVSAEDLIRYGLNEHLVKTFDTITYLPDLEKNDFIHIFGMRNSLLKTKIKLLYENEAIRVKFTEEAETILADHLVKLGKNMKGVESTLDTLLFPCYETPHKYNNKGATIIDRNIVEKRLKIIY